MTFTASPGFRIGEILKGDSKPRIGECLLESCEGSESEINLARQIVKRRHNKVKNVHKRFGGHVVTVDSTGNPKALASTLKEILSDTIQKSQKQSLCSEPCPAATSAPAITSAPTNAPTNAPANSSPKCSRFHNMLPASHKCSRSHKYSHSYKYTCSYKCSYSHA
ncbi:hypothetical protein evm_014242 [Chilo suppressalis]|nr:hypothetical protein evm_014242 [Chilo suppressalis]